MADKETVFKEIIDTGIITVIRTPDAESARKLAEAAFRGGIRAIEITMGTPGALELIKELSSEKAADGMIVGVGTVLDAETARLAILPVRSMLSVPISIRRWWLCAVATAWYVSRVP